MAMHRRPPAGLMVPSELLAFRVEQWPPAPGESADLSWWQPLERWKVARRRWAAEHPGSALGGALEMLRAEHRVWERLRAEDFRP